MENYMVIHVYIFNTNCHEFIMNFFHECLSMTIGCCLSESFMFTQKTQRFAEKSFPLFPLFLRDN